MDGTAWHRPAPAPEQPRWTDGGSARRLCHVRNVEVGGSSPLTSTLESADLLRLDRIGCESIRLGALASQFQLAVPPGGAAFFMFIPRHRNGCCARGSPWTASPKDPVGVRARAPGQIAPAHVRAAATPARSAPAASGTKP